ncbi:MAG: metallophosphoesterase, partial [Phaeodactylibacter sp.]|nr:metallophosphoesterase [Phaeodactylibacter sp.]
KVHRTNVAIRNLPAELSGLRIVQISDIHSGSFTFKEPVRHAIELINKEQADLVFFTGDLVNNTADETEPYLDVFDKIQSRFGVFSVLGNHDYGDSVRWGSAAEKAANLNRLKDIHKGLGWDLLVNEHRLIPIRGAQVAVIGVENYSAKARFPKCGDLSKAYAGCAGLPLQLLLSHDPSHWEEQVLKDYPEIQLTFSGHTHGMQFGVEIPGWIKWSPIQYMYKQWAGLYRQGEQFLYVNRGLGFLGYPGRVGILPEITVLELTPA